VENRIKELGLNIPATPEAPKGNYMSYVQSGNMLFLAGHLPKPADGELICGCVGENMDIEEGKHAAKMASLQMISSMTAALGDLDRVKRIVKINGFVNCTRDFVDQPAVLNGCSDTMVEVFGIEVGRHARSALAANSLPLGVAVEIEAIIEVKD
jgi:enamine deaminase RidA (YjgF/YER057c/UK114 family)